MVPVDDAYLCHPFALTCAIKNTAENKEVKY
jgi:hypothetical protein